MLCRVVGLDSDVQQKSLPAAHRVTIDIFSSSAVTSIAKASPVEDTRLHALEHHAGNSSSPVAA
jgi:hypothetical protein